MIALDGGWRDLGSSDTLAHGSSTGMSSSAKVWSWFSADVHEVSMFLPGL